MLRALCLLVFSIAIHPGGARAEVTVFAAASMRSILEELQSIAPTETRVSYAGSAALARQIALGAPADVYITAHPIWMDWLVQKGALQDNAVCPLAGNRLVLAGRSGASRIEIETLPDALGAGRLAMGRPETVPAGIYAQEALRYFELWERLKPKVVAADNIRAALRFVTLGEADFGVAYQTDVAADPALTPIFHFPAESHRKIIYQLGILRETSETRAFKTFLFSQEAQAVFRAHGFLELGVE